MLIYPIDSERALGANAAVNASRDSRAGPRDVQALRLALGPILNTRAIELTSTDGVPINFAGLARKAQENE
jgi:hypothetical protein